MHVLLDHISAVIVASILLVSIFTFVNRNRQNAVEMQIGQMVHEQAYEFAKIIERDLENIRSDAQVALAGMDIDCYFQADALGRTVFLSIPTLEDPRAGVASNIVNVIYQLVPADNVINFRGNEYEVFTVNRYRRNAAIPDAPLIPDGSSGAFITHFQVNMYSSDATATVAPVSGLTTCPPDGQLNRSRVEFQAALPGVEYISENQKSTSNLNVTRFGATVYSPNR